MKTLNYTLIQDKDELWYESFDTTCPFCGGTGEREIEVLHTTVEKPCQHCDESGHFEIYWNTIFEVPYLKDSLSFEDAKKLAWRHGWLLVEYDNEYWLAAGSCGYDFTWVRAACILDLCGTLPIEYANDQSRGGYVFVNETDKKRIAEATIESLNHVIRNAQFDVAEMSKLLTETN